MSRRERPYTAEEGIVPEKCNGPRKSRKTGDHLQTYCMSERFIPRKIRNMWRTHKNGAIAKRPLKLCYDICDFRVLNRIRQHDPPRPTLYSHTMTTSPPFRTTRPSRPHSLDGSLVHRRISLVTPNDTVLSLRLLRTELRNMDEECHPNPAKKNRIQFLRALSTGHLLVSTRYDVMPTTHPRTRAPANHADNAGNSP